VHAVRRTLAQLAAPAAAGGARLDPESGALLIDGGADGAVEREVSVVYFRAGYTPDDYDFDPEVWVGRPTSSNGDTVPRRT
jgi:hypothetical protein